jgi:ketosteroid isomerase-like protein
MSLDYAAAGEMIERYGQAWQDFDGDAWVDLFTDDIEYAADPFEAPLVGHNAVRAYLNEAAEQQDQVAFTAERHWVVDPTVLIAWHAGYVQRSDRAQVRLAGFMAWDVRDGKIARLREWHHRRASPAAG